MVLGGADRVWLLLCWYDADGFDGGWQSNGRDGGAVEGGGGAGMTEAEKIARYFGDIYYNGDWVPIKRIIHQVIKRTREECLKETIKSTIGKLSDVKVVLASVIRDAKWEDKEA